MTRHTNVPLFTVLAMLRVFLRDFFDATVARLRERLYLTAVESALDDPSSPLQSLISVTFFLHLGNFSAKGRDWKRNQR